ncbi:MAG: hypothetical protein LBS45_02195 [Synergistaceae bacterium]|jgi:hypothetical protein|nr:hypothetical protein [Synergistaceae bacterium]
MKICSRCGNNLTWNRSFCPLCGGFLVEKPDDAVFAQSMDYAPQAARQEPAPTVQPQQTLPPDVSPLDEAAAFVGSDGAQAAQSAPPIYDYPPADTTPPVIPTPQPIYDYPPADAAPPAPKVPDAPARLQSDEPPRMPSFGQENLPGAAKEFNLDAPLSAPRLDSFTGANEPEPVRQPPKPTAAEPFLGIMKGSSGGRVDMIPQKEQRETQPAQHAGDGTFERIGAPEDIKAYSNAPNVDMFSRKKESLIPQSQPGIQAAEQLGSRLKPGVADSQRVVGFTVPVPAPQGAGTPVPSVPPLPPTEEIPRLFSEAATQPPVPSVPIRTTPPAFIPPSLAAEPAASPPPAVPIMPAAQAMPIMPPPGVTPVQPTVVQTHPTDPFFGVMPPPPIQAQPTPEWTSGATPPPLPTPPIPQPLDMTQAQPLGGTPLPTPTTLTPPLGATPPPLPIPPQPVQQAQPQPPQVSQQAPLPAPQPVQPPQAQPLPPQVSQQAPLPAPQPVQPPQAQPQPPQVSQQAPLPAQQPVQPPQAQPLPPQVSQQVAMPAQPPVQQELQDSQPLPQQVSPPTVQPAMSRFAELIPKSQPPLETSGQPQLPEQPPTAAPVQPADKADNFQPFHSGEFLKMFPEAKPD